LESGRRSRAVRLTPVTKSRPRRETVLNDSVRACTQRQEEGGGVAWSAVSASVSLQAASESDEDI
jgi:hypothetical protein